ncbi:VOC family protein [Nocardia sp. NPDC046473]|uniref:VOC family protein n=1 Tax=Nocardia sp. NPDC046473 TaxID=3155733 RepID=UPI003408FB26
MHRENSSPQTMVVIQENRCAPSPSHNPYGTPILSTRLWSEPQVDSHFWIDNTDVDINRVDQALCTARSAPVRQKGNLMSNNPAKLMAFELGSANLPATQKFYEQAFGWKFTDGTNGPGNPFGFANLPEGSNIPFGTVWDTTLGGGREGTPEAYRDIPDEYLAFVLLVDDLKEACRLVEEAGGKAGPPMTNDDGTFDAAHIRDVNGTLIGLCSMNVSSDSVPHPNPVPEEMIGQTPLPDALLDQRDAIFDKRND